VGLEDVGLEDRGTVPLKRPFMSQNDVS